MKQKDITGQKFNRLTAIRFHHKIGKGRDIQHYWLFKCFCGNEKIIRKYDVTSGRIKSCKCLCEYVNKNRKGKRNGMFGKNHTEKTKKKMSKFKIGKYIGKDNPFYGEKHTLKTIEKISGKNHHMFGRTHTKEARRKISEAHKGKKRKPFTDEHRKNLSKNHANICGENHPNWLDGKSFEPYGLEFNNQLKRKILERDNNICQECGKKTKRKLDVHHIDYNKRNNKENNLISLCKSCHSKTNFKRRDWTKYFKNKIYE